MIAGLFDAYPKASSTKMIAGLFNAYSLLKIGTYKPSSVVLKLTRLQNKENTDHVKIISYYIQSLREREKGIQTKIVW